MRTWTVAVVAIAIAAGIAIGMLVDRDEVAVESQTRAATPGPAVAGQTGGQDQTGPYAVAENWPKPLSQLRGHEKWTWGAVQVFDENGTYLDQFATGNPSTPQVLYLSADKHLWVADNDTSKIVKYDMDGRYQYSWGSRGEWPGAMWNVHGMSVDQEGNLYLAEVNNGRAQKFRPRPDADKAHLAGPPLRAR